MIIIVGLTLSIYFPRFCSDSSRGISLSIEKTRMVLKSLTLSATFFKGVGVTILLMASCLT